MISVCQRALALFRADWPTVRSQQGSATIKKSHIVNNYVGFYVLLVLFVMNTFQENNLITLPDSEPNIFKDAAVHVNDNQR